MLTIQSETERSLFFCAHMLFGTPQAGPLVWRTKTWILPDTDAYHISEIPAKVLKLFFNCLANDFPRTFLRLTKAR